MIKEKEDLVGQLPRSSTGLLGRMRKGEIQRIHHPQDDLEVTAVKAILQVA